MMEAIMAARRRRNLVRKTKSSPLTRGASLSQRTYILILVTVIVAVGIVATLVLFNQSSSSQTVRALGDVSLDKSKGDENAPVVVVEYADFQCPYCGQFATEPEQQLEAEYVETGQVRFVYRNFAFIGEESIWAAVAAECANAQGRFWDYHDKLFAEQNGENEGAFNRDRLKQFGAELGLDATEFDSCVDTQEYREKIQAESDEARQVGINSTPTLFVNGRKIEGGNDYRVLKAAIESALNQTEN
jgi:protein-disulfide isomerase